MRLQGRDQARVRGQGGDKVLRVLGPQGEQDVVASELGGEMAQRGLVVGLKHDGAHGGELAVGAVLKCGGRGSGLPDGGDGGVHALRNDAAQGPLVEQIAT